MPLVGVPLLLVGVSGDARPLLVGVDWGLLQIKYFVRQFFFSSEKGDVLDFDFLRSFGCVPWAQL